MNIGILTYGRIANFGANLQSSTTYMYLQKRGYTPIYIYYLSEELYKRIENNRKFNPQIQAHYDFFDSIVKNRTALCHTIEDINNEIEKKQIDAIIIGADAVLQHHPLLSRLFVKKGLKVVSIYRVTPDRLFPNFFWGEGINPNLKMAMMSVSCQNSEYKLFSRHVKCQMSHALKKFKYISVRDSWTQKMINHIDKELNVSITPDPVFAFNYIFNEILPSRQDIHMKYRLPQKYVLISLFRQTLSKSCLDELKKGFGEKGISCVALPMPDEGINFSHSFDYVIPTPLSPIDWYSLIKYSSGYIGENMHPIVSCLHNAIPCYSIDNWGTRNMLGYSKNNGSSKVEDILRIFGVDSNRTAINRGKCLVSASEIIKKMADFPIEAIRLKSDDYYKLYLEMMDEILTKLSK